MNNFTSTISCQRLAHLKLPLTSELIDAKLQGKMAGKQVQEYVIGADCGVK